LKTKKVNMKYQNIQFWSECQLVALWNACIFHGKKPPELKSWKYALICIDAGGIYGACTNIKREVQRLGLKCIPGRWSLDWVKKNLPVGFSLFTHHRGYHKVLCIDVYKNKLLLANYAWERLYWLSWKNVKKIKCKEVPLSIQMRCKNKRS